ncbi:MAG: hypothetical protein JWQ18_2904, partial [Conexibacter sp.]|nr:hypothetical protein [Conexibacter sp.]
APAATTTPAPTTTTAKLTFEAKQAHKGTMRLAALPIGWKGGHIDVVKPKGLADPDVAGYYYFKQGTTVKLRVRATGKAQFAQWAGACAGTQRTCTVKMNDVVRVLAGFLPKKGTKTT